MGKNKLKKQKVAELINNHINLINKTAKYPTKIEDYSLGYLVSGIGDEYGEFIEKYEQFYDNYKRCNDKINYNKDFLKACYKEAGDVLWYINTLITKVINISKAPNIILNDEFYNKVINNINSTQKSNNNKFYSYDFLNEAYDNSGFSNYIESYKMISKLLGISKKFYRDNKYLDNDLILEILNYIVCSVLTDLNYIINAYHDYKSEKYLKPKKAAKLILKKVINLNIEKLLKRNETNTIHGDGDDRENQPNPIKFELHNNLS